MNHLSDSQLNEYLDNVVDMTARHEIDLHLAACEECPAQLAELQTLFSDLEGMPEIKPTHDLTSSVMARLPNKQSRLWTPAFAAQLGAALGVLFWLSTQVTKLIMPFTFHIPQFAILTLQLGMPNFQFSNLISLFSIPYSLLSVSYSPSPIFNLATIQLLNWSTLNLPFDVAQGRLSTFNIIVIAASVFVLWLVGNLSLLRNHSGVQK